MPARCSRRTRMPQRRPPPRRRSPAARRRCRRCSRATRWRSPRTRRPRRAPSGRRGRHATGGRPTCARKTVLGLHCALRCAAAKRVRCDSRPRSAAALCTMHCTRPARRCTGFVSAGGGRARRGAQPSSAPAPGRVTASLCDARGWGSAGEKAAQGHAGGSGRAAGGRAHARRRAARAARRQLAERAVGREGARPPHPNNGDARRRRHAACQENWARGERACSACSAHSRTFTWRRQHMPGRCGKHAPCPTRSPRAGSCVLSPEPRPRCCLACRRRSMAGASAMRPRPPRSPRSLPRRRRPAPPPAARRTPALAAPAAPPATGRPPAPARRARRRRPRGPPARRPAPAPRSPRTRAPRRRRRARRPRARRRSRRWPSRSATRSTGCRRCAWASRSTLCWCRAGRAGGRAPRRRARPPQPPGRPSPVLRVTRQRGQPRARWPAPGVRSVLGVPLCKLEELERVGERMAWASRSASERPAAAQVARAEPADERERGFVVLLKPEARYGFIKCAPAPDQCMGVTEAQAETIL